MSIFTNAKVMTVQKTHAGRVTVVCANKSCRKSFTARAADRARGWGKFCSKSCKAIKQEARTGQFSSYLQGQHSEEGSNRWIDENGNRCSRRFDRTGNSIVSTVDEMTGHVSNEEFDRHGLSRGFQMSAEDLSYGGYGDADADTPFGDGKY